MLFILLRGLPFILLILLLSAQAPPPPAKFLMPKSRIVMAGPSGHVTFLVQAWVTRHKDNRAVTISWNGDGCAGSATNFLEGEYSDAVQPASPLNVQATLGECNLAISLYGPGDKVRFRTEMTMEIR